jgi:predicted TIM-barrel fold metal-dependent hydrolase
MKNITALAYSVAGALLAVVFCAHLLLGGPSPRPADAAPIAALTPYIDVHAHLDPDDPDGSVQAALRTENVANAATILLLPLPFAPGDPGIYDAEAYMAAVKMHPGKLAFLGGGGSLNLMIQEALRSGDSGAEVQRKFKERAEAILAEGARGFGELTAEHFKGATAYQYAPADHPLFLLLADIAAQHDVPIDLHMEAVPRAMALPANLKSPPNPPQLHENIAPFERLLEHNPRAKIVWAHAGSDGTGERTVELDRRLLMAHANLYMEIKVDPVDLGKNPPIDADGKIKPDWLKLFEEFPDRFVIGSDQHYPEPKEGPQRWQADVLLLNQLPAGVRRKVAMENAMRLYGLH